MAGPTKEVENCVCSYCSYHDYTALSEEVKKENAKSRVDFWPPYGLLIRGMKPLVLLIGKNGAGYQNRTDDSNLEGWRITIIQIPRKLNNVDGIEPSPRHYRLSYRIRSPLLGVCCHYTIH